MNKLLEPLPPTQDQLIRLYDTILSHEPYVEPFDGIPADVNLTEFVDLAAPPSHDATIAPAATLRTPDMRVIWLSVFRDPDTNAVLRPAVTIVDPPENRGGRDEVESENYALLRNALGGLVLERSGVADVSKDDVEALQGLIDASVQINPFD